MTRARVLPFACLLLLLTRDGFAQSDAGLRSSGQAELASEGVCRFLETLIPGQLQQRRIAGAVVTVVKDGDSCSNGYGYADMAARRAMTADTPVRIGSITKTLTALAAMQLVDAGKLDLDRDVNTYIDFVVPLSHRGTAISVRTLLSHQTGFEDHHGSIAGWSGERVPLGPYLARQRPHVLSARPGLVAYSNYNAALVAYVVERVSGEPFEQYLAGHIFMPLGMTSTTASQMLPEPLRNTVSSGYLRSDLPPTPVSMASVTIYETGSAGVTTTATDMSRLLRALLDPTPTLVSRASLDAMQTTQTEVPRGVIGLGVYSPLGQGANPFIGHDGDTGAFHSTLALLREKRLGLFVSYNSDGVPAALAATGELLQRIAAQYAPAARAPGVRAGGVAAGTYAPARSVESSFFKLQALLAQVSVDISGDTPTIRPAFLPFGERLERVDTESFRWSGREVSFAGTGASAVLQLGAPVLQLRPVRWWEDAGLVVPLLLVCTVAATLTVFLWLSALVRRPANPNLRTSRVLSTRVALLLHLFATGSAVWLVFWGWPLVATGSAIVTPLAIGIYGAAWLAVVLTPVALWRVVRLRSGLGTWGMMRETALAVVLVTLTWFSLCWRIAGVTLSF